MYNEANISKIDNKIKATQFKYYTWQRICLYSSYTASFVILNYGITTIK